MQPDPPPAEDAPIRFLLRLGRAMHAYGYSAEQLERALTAMAGRLGFEGQFFTTPTSIMAALGPLPQQRTFLIRTEPGTIDLGKLDVLDALQNDVLDRKLTPAAALDRVEALFARPGLYGPVARTLAAGIASGSASVFLGGSLRDAACSTIVGAIVGGFGVAIEPGATSARLFESAMACLSWLLAAAMAIYVGPISQANVALSGVVALLPGLGLTLAMSELATGHLSSGSARLIGAITVLFSLAAGVALGSRLSALAFGATPNLAPHYAGQWAFLASVPLAALGFMIVFRARAREFVPIAIAGGLALGGAAVGARWLGPDLGSFIGAFTAAVVSNVFARIRRSPAALTLVPAIVLLVPGSIGFSSLSSLLDRQVVPGVESAFRTVLISVALATGLLIADVLVPPRRR
jgi:uncharacterized membrane protein YjjP (DUF1212 family)